MSRFEQWSRRKRGLDDAHPNEPLAQHDIQPPPAPEVVETLPNDPARESAEPCEIAEGSLDEQLPDPDTLGPGSDFKAFLMPGVSTALRRRALRRMYATGNYHIRDGLDDYDHDYSQMKPLAEGAGERIRQWTKRVADAFDNDASDTDDSHLASADTPETERKAQPETAESSPDEADDDATPAPASQTPDRKV